MKNRLHAILFGSGFAIIGSLTFYGIIHAQTPAITDDQISRIRSSCVSTKNTLSQLHATDALLRVNRGQIYESMSTKLMNRFNDRLSNNRYDTSKFDAITTSYNNVLDTFRLDYQAYEEQLSTALGIDCAKEPVSFYDAIVSARVKRTQVHTDVLQLHQYISQYDSVFLTFQQTVVANKVGQ
jgi:hypothetical protein